MSSDEVLSSKIKVLSFFLTFLILSTRISSLIYSSSRLFRSFRIVSLLPILFKPLQKTQNQGLIYLSETAIKIIRHPFYIEELKGIMRI